MSGIYRPSRRTFLHTALAGGAAMAAFDPFTPGTGGLSG